MARKTRLERAKPQDTTRHDDEGEAAAAAMDREMREGMPPEAEHEPEVAVAQKGPVMIQEARDGEELSKVVLQSGTPANRELHLVPIEWVSPGPWLHRKEIDVERLTELTDSIRQDGIRIPLEAVRKGPTEYLLFSGLRRYRAAGLVGLTTLPVIAYSGLPDDVATRYSILENLHREDLSSLDTAHALERLKESGMDQPEIARALGKTQGWVSQYLSLLRLPREAHKALEEKKISFSQARELERVADEPDTIKSILSKGGTGLVKRIGYVPPEIGDRVKRVLEAKAREEKLAAEVQALKDQGTTFVEDYEGLGDKRYVRLYGWGAESQAHDRNKLQCTVYAPYQGEIAKLCNDPKALRKAQDEERTAQPESAYDREERERKAREEAQHKAITSVLRGWWEAKLPVRWEEVEMFATNALLDLKQEYYAKASLDAMGEILGFVEKKAKKEAIREKVKEAVFSANKSDFLRYWWLYVMIRGMDRVKLEWLSGHGYVDPTAPVKGEEEEVLARADFLMAELDAEKRVDIGIQLYCKNCDYASPESSPAVIRKELEEHLGHWCELRYRIPGKEEHEEDRMAMEQIDAELTPEEAAEMEDQARELAPELFGEGCDA